jgi:monofunctional biosynthetic peptidoglycan transglycosylase
MSGGPIDEEDDAPLRRPVAAPEGPPAPAEPGSLFGEPERKDVVPRDPTEPILYGEIEPPAMADRGQQARARAAQRALDEHLRKAGRSKRFGLLGMIAQVLFVVFVVVPVVWVIVYRFVDPPATALMIMRAADGERISHTPVSLDEMSPHIVRALIASEDQKFCEHDGFDVEAIQRALESNQEGGRLRGGSTISQQTAKNLFLWPSRSWIRKGAEAYFTFLIELFWPKRRIMEAYLNVIEFGDGVFGVEAAAQRRFRVAAADLTPLRAARLAAVVPSPNRYNAVSPGPYVRRQTQRIMREAQSVRARGAAACVLEADRR